MDLPAITDEWAGEWEILGPGAPGPGGSAVEGARGPYVPGPWTWGPWPWAPILRDRDPGPARTPPVKRHFWERPR
jgi:hypothetical protein